MKNNFQFSNLEIKELEKILEYEFRDKSLLTQALTHSSSKNFVKTECYDRFEFLGDAILDFIIADELFERFPNDNSGALTTKRANVVSGDYLEKIVIRMGLVDYIIKGENNNDIYSKKTKVISDIFESIVASIYFDGGLYEAKRFILRNIEIDLFSSDYDGENETSLAMNKKDYKSSLLELVAKKKKTCEFVLVDKIGYDHKPSFITQVIINGVVLGEGEGNTKRESEKNASEKAYNAINTTSQN